MRRYKIKNTNQYETVVCIDNVNFTLTQPKTLYSDDFNGIASYIPVAVDEADDDKAPKFIYSYSYMTNHCTLIKAYVDEECILKIMRDCITYFIHRETHMINKYLETFKFEGDQHNES